MNIFALSATLIVLNGSSFSMHEIDAKHCDGFLRAAEIQMPDADVLCIVRSPRPIARPDDLVKGQS